MESYFSYICLRFAVAEIILLLAPKTSYFPTFSDFILLWPENSYFFRFQLHLVIFYLFCHLHFLFLPLLAMILISYLFFSPLRGRQEYIIKKFPPLCGTSHIHTFLTATKLKRFFFCCAAYILVS